MCNLDAELLSATLTSRVTLVTVNAVVDVARHLIVLEVVRVVVAMAARALEHRIVVRVDMARRTNVVRVAMARWELRVLRMVERRVRPIRGVVAVLARRREELRLRLVSRIGRVVVIGRMAAVTIRGQRRVVPVHMAIRAYAWRHQVRSR